MPAKDLGTKFTCFKCGTKFYDLKKPEPICPKCGADQRESPALKPSAKRAKEKEPVKVAAPEPDELPPDEDEAAEEVADSEDEDEDEPGEDDDF